MKRIANKHAESGLIDYKQRRATLADLDWDGIDTKRWQLIEPRARPLPPQRLLILGQLTRRIDDLGDMPVAALRCPPGDRRGAPALLSASG